MNLPSLYFWLASYAVSYFNPSGFCTRRRRRLGRCAASGHEDSVLLGAEGDVAHVVEEVGAAVSALESFGDDVVVVRRVRSAEGTAVNSARGGRGRSWGECRSGARALSVSPTGFLRETGPHLLPASFLLDSGGELIATAEKTTDNTVRAASPRPTRAEDWRAGLSGRPSRRVSKKNATGMCAETTTRNLMQRASTTDCPSMTSVPIDVATVVDHVSQKSSICRSGSMGEQGVALPRRCGSAAGLTAPAARHR